MHSRWSDMQTRYNQAPPLIRRHSAQNAACTLTLPSNQKAQGWGRELSSCHKAHRAPHWLTYVSIAAAFHCPATGSEHNCILFLSQDDQTKTEDSAETEEQGDQTIPEYIEEKDEDQRIKNEDKRDKTMTRQEE